MAKDTFYFSHDYNARHDDKIKKLIRNFGYEGYGLFWALIEDLYNNNNSLELDYSGFAYEYRCDENKIKSIINDFGFFSVNHTHFGSVSIERRIDERNAKSQKARSSALIRWSGCNANALKVNANASEIDAIKKVSNNNKESIVSMPDKPAKPTVDFDVRKKIFYDDIATFKDDYPKEMLRVFYTYWSEKNRSGKKMRFELERTWETKLRLATWANRDKGITQPSQTDTAEKHHNDFEKALLNQQKKLAEYGGR